MIEIKNLYCSFEIDLEKDGEEFKHLDEFCYGPTGDKVFDLVSTPAAFLQNLLEVFDYDIIKEINLTITQK